MSSKVMGEAAALRQELAILARQPEWQLLARYDLLAGKRPLRMRDRVSRTVRKVLTMLRLAPPRVTSYPWTAVLKHAAVDAGARTLLIWAPGVPRDELRQGCEGVARRLRDDRSLAPILVTDVADFAWFSRLGWLIEYLPALSGPGQDYLERKRRYLAWRYRDALIVPLSAGHASDAEWNMLTGSRHR